MMKPIKSAITGRARTNMAMLLAALLISSCGTVKPRPTTEKEVLERVQEDAQQMYRNQAPIAGDISLEEAMARALKYNLDYRLKKMESALAFGLSEQSNYDMLPRLAASAGYRTRDNDSGGTSIGIVDKQQSLRPSTSEDRSHTLSNLEVSWNVLDFGVSYYRAKQQADEFLIAEERRRKVVQNILQDVRAAYWRALGAQRLEGLAKNVLMQAETALANSREAEASRLISPALALNFQRALLDATSLLNQRRQDLIYAKTELAALMNVPTGQEFMLANTRESKLPPAPCDIAELEETALLQRPELRQEDLKKRITAAEARKQLLGMLPGISFDAGAQYDSNRQLHNNNWFQGGLGISWNLMRLAALPSMEKAQERQVETDTARRLALAMAVLTQVRVGNERYRMAIEDFGLADNAAQVDRRLAEYTKASVKAKLESQLEEIRTEARAVLGAYQRANAYANVQIAFGRLYNTLGTDPLPDNFNDENLETIATRLHNSLRNIELEWFIQKTNPGACGQKNSREKVMPAKPTRSLPAVSVRLVDITDPSKREEARHQIGEFFTDNGLAIDDKKGYIVLIRRELADQPASKKGRKPVASAESTKNNWLVILLNPQGQIFGQSRFALNGSPLNSDSAANAVEVANRAMPNLRTWLSQAARDRK